ncbi:MAG TPA: thiamine pyrophosphate-binding protein [Candidatus Limnocylindrales bacterium]|nr:thiamine pyrophosphate-binding protein [Candidatus Limnocylindrales bacterium]
MPETTGGAIIARMLKQEGVEKFFGIIDGTYMQLFAHCVELGIEMVSPRHEAVAAHMAGAYARLTGKLGVCIASNGPGVANMLSGVAVENGEGNRVLLLTSSRRTGITYPDRGGAYQCFDHVAVIRGMSKWSQTVTSFSRIAELTRQALRASYSGRPGVVHLDIPENLLNGTGPDTPLLATAGYRRTEPICASEPQVERAVQMLATASLPMIHAGGGVIHAQAFRELAEVAELLHSPVTTSWSARGVMAETSPLVWPMPHIEAASKLRNAADVALVLGSELGETDWWGKAPYWAPPSRQKLIQVDIDDASLGRNRPADLLILADVRRFLEQLAAGLRALPSAGDIEKRRVAVEQLAMGKRADRAALDTVLENRTAPMITGHVAAVCRKVFDDDAVVVFDGGNTAVWGHFFTELRSPNTMLQTAHFSHLGAGVGQALGAAVARPDRQVYCIIGDGAMAFHMQEIETAIRCGLKPVFLVCCDRQWGMVKINQMMALQSVRGMFTTALGPDGSRTINTDLGEIEWDHLAMAMGAYGERISDPADLEPALRRCLAEDRCSVIHVDVEPTAHLFAPGLQYFKDMHQEPAGE